MNISLDAFKLNGKLENLVGDIGVLVKFTLENGEEYEGVGFIEAKKLYKPEEKFKKLDINQLQRHTQFSTYHKTLFYLPSERTVPPLNPSELFYANILANYNLSTNATTLSSKRVIALNSKSPQILKNSLPLSSLLFHRYFLGDELDYAQESIERAKGFMDDKQGGVKYLLVSHVSMQPEVKPDFSTVKVNKEKYSLIKQERPSNPSSGLKL